MLLAAFVAGIGLAIIQAKSLSVLGDFLFAQVGVGCIDGNVFIRSCRHRLRHRVDEALATVGIDGMVACMVGYHHPLQAVALGNAGSDGQHDAVAEWYHRRFHVLIVVVAFRNVVSSHQQGTLEIAVHELQGYHDVPDAQALAMGDGADALTTILCRAIVEGDGQGDFILVFIQHRGGVHASRYDNHCVFHRFYISFLTTNYTNMTNCQIIRVRFIRVIRGFHFIMSYGNWPKGVVSLYPDAQRHRSWRKV